MIDSKTLLRDNIRKLRSLHGFTQAELAERCDLSPNYIAEIEAGRRFPSPDTMDAFCEAFKVRPFELFVDDSDGSLLADREPISMYRERLKGFLVDSIDRFS